VLHALLSEAVPSQSDPPFAGVGLVHDLVRT